LDMIIVATLLVAFELLYFMQKLDIEEIEGKSLQIKDFTIEVRNMLWHMDPIIMKARATDIVEAFDFKEGFRPNVRVANVVLGYSDMNDLKLEKEMYKEFKNIIYMEKELERGAKKEEKTKKKLKESRDKLRKLIVDFERWEQSYDPQPIVAFVTMRYLADAQRILKEVETTTSCYTSKIIIKQAPQPSNLIWGNMNASIKRKCFYTFIQWFIFFVTSVATFIMIFVGQRYVRNADREYNIISYCGNYPIS